MDGWSEIVDNAPLCASERCNQMGVAAQWRLELGDIGSSYCSECKSHIEDQQDYARRDAEASMSGALSTPKAGRLPVLAAADRNINMAITGAIRVISDPYASDTDKTLVLYDLDIASKQHKEAVQRRQVERRRG